MRDRAARPEEKPLRLFVAIEVSEEVRRAVSDAIVPWRDEFPQARWVPEENWHVTVKFLGRTYPRLVGWVHECVEEVVSTLEPFDTGVTELGSFPSPRRARVVWVGLEDGDGRMADIALALDAALSEGFRPEARPFQPHLTVARSDPALRLPEGFPTAIEPVAFEVGHVTLFRSHVRRPAPWYEPLATFLLGG